MQDALVQVAAQFLPDKLLVRDGRARNIVQPVYPLCIDIEYSPYVHM